mgnify:CR=1 FL=1
MARIAKSLDVLRSQINKAHPDRSKLSDGWIGDAAHAAGASDHNPTAAGVVTALDITHDPAKGVDTWALAETLRQNRDQRIKYVISNGRIFSSVTSPWQWRPYTGANKHAHHVHVSVSGNEALYDSTEPWKLTAGAVSQAPVVSPPKGISADMRRRMAKAIIDFEARRENGKLAVYRLPANDGGGSYEVAGINDRYHPEQAAKLKALIEAGRHDEAERSVADYLVNYTKAAAGWTEHAGVEFYLRDSIFNRGPKGAARILQRGLGIEDDGEVGPTTRAAMAKLTPDELLTKLRAGRENYERQVVGFRANFWKGLNNRWDKALVKARAFQKEQGSLPPAVKRTIEIGVGGGAAGYTFWDWIVAHPFLSLVIVSAVVGLALYGWYKFQTWRDVPPEQPVAPIGTIIKEI